jgi:hypothetical protein
MDGWMDGVPSFNVSTMILKLTLTKLSQHSLVSIVTRVWVGQLGFNSWQGQGLLLATMPTQIFGPTQPPV